MTFDAHAMTERLQTAVREHDRASLDDLVSERFVFVSSRSIQRFGESGYDEMPGKAEWLDAATTIAWVSFTIDGLRTVELDDVVVVDCRMSQRMRHGDDVIPSSWVVLDLWVLEDASWRLLARHAALAAG